MLCAVFIFELGKKRQLMRHSSIDTALDYEIKKQNNSKRQYVINKNGKLLTNNS